MTQTQPATTGLQGPTHRLGWTVEGVHGSLVGDLHLPASCGSTPAPVILLRTPYGRAAFHSRGRWWAARGYAVAVQDVAGRYDSAGPWCPYDLAVEREDAARTIDKLAQAPWCDGRVIAAGASYGAYCAWAAAIARPATVCAVVSEVPALGPPRTTRDSGGLLRLLDHVGWWLAHGETRVSRAEQIQELMAADRGALDPARGVLAALPDRLGVHAPDFAAALERSTDPLALGALSVPSLHVTGWHDRFLADAFALWRAVGADLTAPPAAQLVVGPWGHELDGPARHDRTLGWLAAHAPLAAHPPQRTRTLTGGRQRRWLPLTLDGIEQPWRTGADTPHRPDPVALALTPDGLLCAKPPGGSPAVAVLSHDPAAPTGSTAPATDRRELSGATAAHARWWTAPLTRAIELDGQPTLTAPFRAEPRWADWVVHLEARRADGTVLALARGSAATDAPSGVLHITLPPVAAALPAGAQLGVTLATCDHPELVMHPRTPDGPVHAAIYRRGVQHLLAPAVLTLAVSRSTPWPSVN